MSSDGESDELLDEIVRKAIETDAVVIKKEAVFKEKVKLAESKAETEGGYVEKSENSKEPKDKEEISKKILKQKSRKLESDKENRVENSKQKVKVAGAKNTGSKRVWDKVQYCVYCEKKVTKISRHLLKVHSTEREVAQIASLEIKDIDSTEVRKRKNKERKRLFDLLRKRGNYNHNNKVIENNEGFLVVEKRPSGQNDAIFLPCEFCLGFYSKCQLSNHMSRCKERPDSFQPGKRVQGHASMMIYTNDSASDRLQLILSKMLVDDVSTCVKKDQLIIQFGNKLCTRLRKDGDQQHYISNKLRELGRLTLETQRCCIDVMSLQDCLIPKNFGFVVEAATELSGWNEEDGTLSAPSIGIKLGHSLKKCGKILKGNAIRGGNRSLVKQADDFDELMRLSWDDEINRVARKELQIRKFNKPLILPLTSDLQALRKHLKFSISSATNALANDNENKEEYRKLATATLCSLILFNRRRSGEPSLIKVKEYEQNLTSTVIHGEVKESLSPFELELCKAFKRLEIRGKKGRKVPLLITREVENAMNLLIKLRGGVLTNPENSYLFCVLGNGSVKNVRGPDAMKKHVRLCGALKNPEAIYSTNLRKHVATLSQLLNLEKRELEMLANFMGHDLSIHREFYRLPEDTLQLAKCGKLMMLMETGGAGKHGKSLSEIEVNLEG